MPHSDVRGPDDAIVREVVRQLSDGAPPAPPWSRVEPAVRDGSRTPSPWRRVAIAAAVVLVVGLGLLWAGRPTFDDDVPADRPKITSETIPPVDEFGAWTDAAPTHQIHLCFARATAGLSDEHEPELIAASNENPQLFPPDHLRVGVFRNIVRPLGALVAHPDTPRDVANELRSLVETYEAAEAGLYDDDGTASPDAGILADAVEVAVADVATLAADPASCWFERTVGRVVLADIVEYDGPDVAARCLAWWQAELAIGDAVRDEGHPLAVEVSRALTRWYDPVPSELVTFERAVSGIEFVVPGARQAALDDAVSGLDQRALGLDRCRSLSPTIDPTMEDSP